MSKIVLIVFNGLVFIADVATAIYFPGAAGVVFGVLGTVTLITVAWLGIRRWRRGQPRGRGS